MILDFVGTIIITAVLVVNINAVVSTLPATRSQRLAAALAVGLWIGLAAASASAGLIALSRPFPVIGLFVAFPLAATAVTVAVSPTWRAALLGLPTPLLIGLNASRVFGALFLLLAAQGRLSGPFPYSAGWGDIMTGVLAVPALWLVVRRPSATHSLPEAWNVFGAADLVAAVSLGLMSAAGSPLQIFNVGAGPSALLSLPWSFIPTVLVPFYLIVHAILFVQLRQTAKVDSNRLIARAA